MAHHSKFLSVNLNNSYGKPSSSPSSVVVGYGNGRPRSAGGGGGMVVLSRPRSSSGATMHKPTPKLAVPPPMNLPSLRKEHERLDPTLSKPSSGHGGSGMGNGNSSSMSWTKPTLPMPDFGDKDGGSRSLATVKQRTFGSGAQPQGFTEKTVILRGEDFPSLMATSTYISKQKQKHENSDSLVEKSELLSVADMGPSPMLRSSAPTKKNVHCSEGGSNRVLYSPEQSKKGVGNFPNPLPLVRLRHTSDWDDDERDRNHVDHYDGHVFPDGEAHSSLSRDSGRGDLCGKEFMAFKREDRNLSSWRVAAEPSREILSSRASLHVEKDHFGHRNSALSRGSGKESSYDRLSYGERKEFGSGMGIENAGVEGSIDRVEVSNNWQRGKSYTNSMMSKGLMSPIIKGISKNDPLHSFTKEKLLSNVGRSSAGDAGWGGEDTFSSDAMLDLKAKVLRKKKEASKLADIFDPARESFEAELERVQRLQEQERRRVMEEQARVMEVARREAEERERIAREEEERRRSLEEEAREAALRAEQEKLEAARRAEELRIAREEEKKKILMEEERRKEAARQKLLELEAKIASRRIQANANDGMKEKNSLISDFDKHEKTETMVEHITNSPSFDSGYLTARQDGFCSIRSFQRKEIQGIHGPKLATSCFKREMSGDQAQTGHSWDRNRDFDQFYGRSNIDAMFGKWDNGHFDGSQSDSYSERSIYNSEVDNLASFSRVRHTVKQPRAPPPPSVSSSIRKNPHAVASVNPNSSLSVCSDARINQTGREEESDAPILYSCGYHERILEPTVEPRMPELMGEPACSLAQTEEKNSPRYDSQSSLSISNPPSSPTQLSHDEFDESGGSAEEENMTFSEGKSGMPELDTGKIYTEIIPFSHGEDDDWAVVDHGKLEEEEEEDHDEDPGSNQEDNEAHESEVWELQMKNQLEDLNVVIEKPMEIAHGDNVIKNHVRLGASDSSEIVDENVKEQADMIFNLVETGDHLTDGIRSSKNSGQNPIAAVSRLPLPSTSASVPSSSQNDVPAKLQFGLFSSPPLIPSPLPTIQIGSIQMPLPLNAQIDSYTNIHPPHPPHPPLFQFGQIVYTPPTSQSVPLASSYTYSPPLAHHLANGNPSKNQASIDSTTTKGSNGGRFSSSKDKQPDLDFEHSTALLDVPRDDDVRISKRRVDLAVSDDKKDLHRLISHPGNLDAVSDKNFRSMGYPKQTRGRPHVDSFPPARKSLVGPKAPRTMSDVRGNRSTYNVRNAGPPFFMRTDISHVNSNRTQRRIQRQHIQGTEYRVKEGGARKMQCTESSNYSGYRGKPDSSNNLVAVLSSNVGKKGAVINKPTKPMNEEAARSSSQVLGADSNASLNRRKETLQTNSHGDEGNLNKNGLLLEADIDAPILSGIVRVFNQPGIEASSDGDGFVEVRSKRKISIERRGQRERETIPKHKATRVPHTHRHCAALSSNGIAKNVRSDPTIVHRRPSSDPEAAKLTTTSMTCQTITAIGSPDVKFTNCDSKSSSLKSSRVGSDLSMVNDGANVEPSLSFGHNIIALDKASVPLGTWGTVHLNQQAANSTQSQFKETLNPRQCNPVRIAEVSPDVNKHLTSIITKEKPSFSSENLPNFPFDGEKIQFGAVVSSPPLPSSQAAPNVIWPPGSVILNSSIILPINDQIESNFFDKDKCLTESDTEAEAEAAASAVAVAVISNDETIASTTTTGSISGIGTKGLSCQGGTSCADRTNQSASESLIVTLPADLFVDTPLSLWPPLPTIQSSRPMLSHIAGPHPSPFPFFDSNQMLGGPIFALRPHDESVGTQAPQQQSPTFIPGATGTWPQCHSGIESSFYGSPAGFPTPFMSSPAGLSGVPPMVFYNHFAPVGQFGQVGLNYMGGAYLPPGKQPEWKHSSDGTATLNVSKADPSNMNVVYGQQNASIQHLSTGPGAMQVTSPFTHFNIRPFQSSTEIPVPAQWPPIPHPHSPNSIRLSSAPALRQNSPSDLPRPTTVDLPDEFSLVESSSSSNSINSQIRNHPKTNINNDSNGIIPNPARGENSDIMPRGSSSQKMSSGSYQYSRRNSFQGKYGSNKSNKNIGSSKMKQIYVPKSLLTTTGTSS